MDEGNIVKLVVLVLLQFLSAFFSSAETAYSTANKIRIETLAEGGDKKAKRALKIINNYSRMLSTVLVGNNIVNITASSVATIFAQEVFGIWAVSIATGILTLVVLLFGEIVPKTWAKINAEKLALVYAPIIEFLCVVLTPIVYVVDLFSKAIMFVLRIDPNKKSVSITEDELLSYVEAGHDEGVIETEEKAIIYNLFDFTDSQAKDVMIPRPDIIEVEVSASYDEIKEVFKEYMYTRIPVYEETPEKIIGVINIKDFLFIDDKEKFSVRDIIRDVYFTYEYKNTSDLLNEMRQKGVTLTIVLNEYGAAEGMVTLEDLLEEIVGDIKDEYDEDERESIKEIADREYLIEGSMKLDDINDKLGISLSSENYDSIGGLIIDTIDDTLPEEGQQLKLEDGTELRVESFSDNRINTVWLKLPEPVEENTEEEKIEEN